MAIASSPVLVMPNTRTPHPMHDTFQLCPADYKVVSLITPLPRWHECAVRTTQVRQLLRLSDRNNVAELGYDAWLTKHLSLIHAISEKCS